MDTRTVRYRYPAVLSTVTVLVNTPLLPRRSTATSNAPAAFEAIFQGTAGSLATVQPQEVRTALTVTSLGEVFVRLNVKWRWSLPASAWSLSPAHRRRKPFPEPAGTSVRRTGGSLAAAPAAPADPQRSPESARNVSGIGKGNHRSRGTDGLAHGAHNCRVGRSDTRGRSVDGGSRPLHRGGIGGHSARHRGRR